MLTDLFTIRDFIAGPGGSASQLHVCPSMTQPYGWSNQAGSATQTFKARRSKNLTS